MLRKNFIDYKKKQLKVSLSKFLSFLSDDCNIDHLEPNQKKLYKDIASIYNRIDDFNFKNIK